MPSPRSLPFSTALVLILLALCPCAANSAEPDPSSRYLEFIKSQADALRRNDAAPADLSVWKAQAILLRQRLEAAWGGFPKTPCPLDPKVLGTLKRDGYRVEKVVFQTMPGVRMTSNLYLPESPGKHPAILMVHGHWKGAKQDPTVQARCIGAAKLGFIALVVDAFGAGERGVGKSLGEYHGEMTAATMLPVGLPLSGIQVYENMRAVDYLLTRPEVDGGHIGVTGASGGGNQTMYAAAMDERLKAASPVCSVGNFRAYLGQGCCLCEVVPGILTFTEESGVLGLTAPRALLVINATRDAPQFSVDEAKKSLAAAGPIFKLYDRSDALRHTPFESGHDYSSPMRSAVYGWMTRYLKGEGDGSPVTEPTIKTEDPEDLRCYPGESRPDDFMTLPKFAASEGRKLLKARNAPRDSMNWPSERQALRNTLVKDVLGGFPAATKRVSRTTSPLSGHDRYVIPDYEPGLELAAEVEEASDKGAPLAVVLDLEGAEKARTGALAAEARKAGYAVVTFDLRATGNFAWKSDKVGNAPDHNSAEWGMFIGRPLLGQWVCDVRCVIDQLVTSDTDATRKIILLGEGPAGLVALTAAATDLRVSGVAIKGSMASYVSETPYKGQRLGVMAPGILRNFGDIGDLAALVVPRQVVVAGGVSGDGRMLGIDALREAYRPASLVSMILDSPKALTIVEKPAPAEIIRAFK